MGILVELALQAVLRGPVLGRFAGLCGGVETGLPGEQILREGELRLPNAAALVFPPTIGGSCLGKDSFGVLTMAENGDHGYKDGKDTDDERDAGHTRLANLAHLLGKF